MFFYSRRSLVFLAKVTLVLTVAAFGLQCAFADAGSADRRVVVRDGQIFKGSQPFFPIGFVFGWSDEDLKHAKTLGANSLHMEYSIHTLFPNSPDAPSEDGLKTMHMFHDIAVRNEITFFPLLSAHYLPGWLPERTAGPPKDVDGNGVGGWFRFSIHDPAFLDILDKFWTTVAKEVGSDPNVGAFVTWNEPMYGLDATPHAMKVFRDWLKARYAGVEQMNSDLGTQFASFDDVQAPKTPDENRAYWYLWVCYNQEAFAGIFARQREIIRGIAPEANLSGKHPVSAVTGDALHCNDIVLQAATQDIYGCDAYNGSLFHYRDVMEVARSLNPYGPVLTYESRAQKAIPPSKAKQSALQMFAQVIGGVRGMFFFCLSPDPTFGFETDSATPPDVRAELTKLFRLIRDNQAVFSAPRPQAEIAVLLSNPSTIHYGTGKDTTLRDEYTRRLVQTFDMVRNQHFAVDFISDRQLAGKLAEYKLLVIPSLSILDADNLRVLSNFHRRGGKILAFGKSLDRNERFEPSPPPATLGLKSRGPSPWNRGQMRLVEVVPELEPYFRTELTVQSPEIVDALPMEQLIPGYIPKTKVEQTWLVGNQDAYPSIIQSNDGKVVYCAFDSLYSEGLSYLLGGIIEKRFGLAKEVSAKRDGLEALELMTAISDSVEGAVLMVANAGPNPGEWECRFPGPITGKLKSIRDGKTVSVRDGKFKLKMGGYDYNVFMIPERN